MSPEPFNRPGPMRRKRLIKPRLQLRLAAAFFGVALLALLVQFCLFGFLALRFANRLPVGGEYLIDALPGMLLLALAGSLAVLLPAILLTGVAVTFPLVGPIYRFEEYFRSLAKGEELGPCQIRQGDHLQELCASINEALEARGVLVDRDADEGEIEAGSGPRGLVESPDSSLAA